MNCEALFQPITIGSMTLKNRIMLPGMTTRLCLDGGYVSDGMIAYYSRIARGGCGLIVVEATSVHAPTAPGNFLRICGEERSPYSCGREVSALRPQICLSRPLCPVTCNFGA